MKKIIISMTLLNLLLNSFGSIFAQEAPDPYIVTQDINYESISLEDCLNILQNPTDESLEAESINGTIEEVEAELQLVQAQYNELNNYIALLESGEVDSLDWANSQLLIVIEEVYALQSELDPEFIYLSEEEQLNLVASHESVLEWQAYIQEIQVALNQLIADRNVVEQNYSNLNFTLNELHASKENTSQSKAAYNECQLYPYSSEYLSTDQILLNSQTSLNDYLVQIDTYLEKIVAKAYRKVAFEDIYRLYSEQLDQQALENALADKPNIVLDNLAYETYSYAKELSLIDIETLAQYAQRAFIKNNNKDEFIQSYQKVINLKENQWNYIYSINTEAFELIKSELVNYLNSNMHTNEEAVNLVRSIHQRYQVKLVFFDDSSQQWVTNSMSSSGYYDEYVQKDISSHALEEALSGESTSEIDSENNDELTLDETLDEVPDNLVVPNDHLESLKDQLSNVRSNTNIKDLPKPSASNSMNNKNKENKGEKTNKGNIELPSTGERKPMTVIAIIILVIGLILLFTTLRIKRKKRETLQDIELD